MSVINNSLSPKSEEFEVLQPEESADYDNDDIFISVEDWKIAAPQPHEPAQEDMTIGIVIDQETFIVLEKKESSSEFGSNDWRQFIAKKHKEIVDHLSRQENSGFEVKYRMTLRQKNAILAIGDVDTDLRKRFWDVANYTESIQQEFRIKQKSDQQSRQEILTILSYELTECEIKSLKHNVLKIHKIVKAIAEQRYNSIDAHRLWMYEKEIMQWIYDSLIRYAIEDQQVRYCKGLEYICLGVVIAYPLFDLAKYSQLLHHFLNVNGFRELYQEGSPRFFRELQRIRQALKEDSPIIYEKIEESSGDFKNLFVTYFRSCLIYRVTNTEIIRKIFQLLFVQGIQAMKVILLRILEIQPNEFLQKGNFLENISSQVILSYFEDKACNHSIQSRFERLFII